MTFWAIARFVSDEIGRKRAIGVDTSNSSRCKKNCVGLCLPHPSGNVFRTCQVKIFPPNRQDLAAFARQTPYEGGSHHSPVTRDKHAPIL
jgi:hypothetical protein